MDYENFAPHLHIFLLHEGAALNWNMKVLQRASHFRENDCDSIDLVNDASDMNNRVTSISNGKSVDTITDRDLENSTSHPTSESC